MSVCFFLIVIEPRLLQSGTHHIFVAGKLKTNFFAPCFRVKGVQFLFFLLLCLMSKFLIYSFFLNFLGNIWHIISRSIHVGAGVAQSV